METTDTRKWKKGRALRGEPQGRSEQNRINEPLRAAMEVLSRRQRVQLIDAVRAPSGRKSRGPERTKSDPSFSLSRKSDFPGECQILVELVWN